MSILDKGDKNDGTFWLSYHDFLVHFEGVDVCKAHQGWFADSVYTYTQSTGRLDCENSFIMTVIEPTWLYVTVIQKSKRGRFRTAEDRRYWYRPICVAVIDDSPDITEESSYAVVRGFRACSPRRDSPPLELHLSAGRYRIVPIVLPIKTTSTGNPRERFIIRVFSSRQLIIECDQPKIATQSNSQSSTSDTGQEIEIHRQFQLQLAVKALLSVFRAYFTNIDELETEELLGLDCGTSKVCVRSYDCFNQSSDSVVDLTEEADIDDDMLGEVVVKVLCGRGIRFVVASNCSFQSASVNVSILSTNFTVSSPFEFEKCQMSSKMSVLDGKNDYIESNFQFALPMRTYRLVAIYARNNDTTVCSLDIVYSKSEFNSRFNSKRKHDRDQGVEVFGVHTFQFL